MILMTSPVTVLMVALSHLIQLGSSQRFHHGQIFVKNHDYSSVLTNPLSKSQRKNIPSRILQTNDEANKHPFAIEIDYSLSKSIDHEILTFLDQGIMRPVQSLFREMIQIQGNGILPSFNETGCFDSNDIPDRYKQSSSSCDLLLFISVQTLDSNVNAQATSCGLDSLTSRPLIGHMLINQSYLEISYYKIEKIKSSIIHELLHILAFDVELFDILASRQGFAYRTETLQSISQLPGTYFIAAPKVVDFARHHFNCSNLTELQMEDDGSISSRNSHFDKIVAGNEIMTAQAEGRQILSGLTLSLLESTGWYKVDSNFAEDWSYGRNKGCFWQKGQNSIAEQPVCSEHQMYHCSDDLISKTLCVQCVFNDNTAQFLPLETLRCSHQLDFTLTSPFEIPTRYSRCLETEFNSQKSAGCYPVKCDNGTVSVFVSEEIQVCSYSGQILKFKEVQVKCGELVKLCQPPKCPNDCSGNGICLDNGKCKCNLFFSGESCENIDDCTLSESLCPLLYLDFGKQMAIYNEKLPNVFKPSVKAPEFVASGSSKTVKVNRGILIPSNQSSYESQLNFSPAAFDTPPTNTTDINPTSNPTTKPPESNNPTLPNVQPQVTSPLASKETAYNQSQNGNSARSDSPSPATDAKSDSYQSSSAPVFQTKHVDSVDVEQRAASDGSQQSDDLDKDSPTQQSTTCLSLNRLITLTILMSIFY